MSMYRQLWLAIIISTLLALCGGLLASLLSARGYLESQLAVKNADNATALALSLSQGIPDEVTVDLVVASLFDRGHYELIRVNQPSGALMTERVAPMGDLGVPGWFVKALPIHSQPGIAQINNGWKQFGTVTLVSHVRFVYAALWKSAYQMVVALLAAGLVGGYLGSLVLRRLRVPLDTVIDQARAITQRRFITVDEPRVPELRQLAAAMNATVRRLKSMFDEETKRLEEVRREANCDALTGLANRSYFMARLHGVVSSEESEGGTLVIARLAHLGAVNEALGRAATDQLLQGFAAGLSTTAAEYPDSLVARLNGPDFALLVPSVAIPEQTVGVLLQRLIRSASAFSVNSANAWITCGHFPRGMDVPLVLANVDAALAALETQGGDGFSMVDMHAEDDTPRNAAQWTQVVQTALETGRVKLVSFPVSSFDGRLIHVECPLRLMFTQDGAWQPASKFLPMAERLKLTHRLDLTAVRLGLAELQANPGLNALAINLSAISVQAREFRQELRSLLKASAESSRLWLEVSETGVLTHMDAFRSLSEDLRDTGCKLGVEHVGRQFSAFGQMHDLGLDYIKVDSSFIRGLISNSGNQAFLRGLSAIATGIGLTVIAEGVDNLEDLQVLQGLGFHGATGPVIKDEG